MAQYGRDASVTQDFPHFFGGNGRVSCYLQASPSTALLFRGCQRNKKCRKYAVECAAERVIARCRALPKARFPCTFGNTFEILACTPIKASKSFVWSKLSKN